MNNVLQPWQRKRPCAESTKEPQSCRSPDNPTTRQRAAGRRFDGLHPQVCRVSGACYAAKDMVFTPCRTVRASSEGESKAVRNVSTQVCFSLSPQVLFAHHLA
jgi:hypothetical protein